MASTAKRIEGAMKLLSHQGAEPGVELLKDLLPASGTVQDISAELDKNLRIVPLGETINGGEAFVVIFSDGSVQVTADQEVLCATGEILKTGAEDGARLVQ